MLKYETRQQLDKMTPKEATVRLLKMFYEHKINNDQFMEAMKYVRNKVYVKENDLKCML